MTHSRLIGALTVVAIIVTACGSQPKSQPAVAPTGDAAAATQVPAGQTVPAQLQFSAKTLDGHDFHGESLLGKPAVLWFWACCPARSAEWVPDQWNSPRWSPSCRLHVDQRR